MRRIHLMVALIGLAALSTQAIANPHVGPGAGRPVSPQHAVRPGPAFHPGLSNRPLVAIPAAPVTVVGTLPLARKAFRGNLGVAFQAQTIGFSQRLRQQELTQTLDANPVDVGSGQPPAQGEEVIQAGYESTTNEEWGMQVTEVFDNGPAQQADLRVGDIIVQVRGKRIQSFDELAGALADCRGDSEFVIVNGENNKLEKLRVVPVNGKIGIATVATVVE